MAAGLVVLVAHGEALGQSLLTDAAYKLLSAGHFCLFVLVVLLDLVALFQELEVVRTIPDQHLLFHWATDWLTNTDRIHAHNINLRKRCYLIVFIFASMPV